MIAANAVAQQPSPGPLDREASLIGQYEGRIELAPGVVPAMLTDEEKTVADRGRRLLSATKLFLRLGPKGAAKLSSSIVNGPTRSEVARWSLVGSLLKVDRPNQKGAPALVGILPKPGVDGRVARLALDLSQMDGRLKGRLIFVRTGP